MIESRSESETPREGVVLNASRRFIQILADEGPLDGTSSSQSIDILVGDRVQFVSRGDDIVISRVLPRKNTLSRTYRGEARNLVANLDHLFVVSATPTLFQSLFIDRVLTVAALQEIPCTLLVNKLDLGLGELATILEAYRRASVSVILTSAKFGEGMDELRVRLNDQALRAAAFAGISGVGKSTILNKLVPDAARRTAEVSARTGQGRQTTTQAYALRYPRAAAAELLLVDLPGVQQFGVGHLSRAEVAAAFPEIRVAAAGCRFDNCAHLGEGNCGVKRAVADGVIAQSRYDSYCKMIEEIEEARPY